MTGGGTPRPSLTEDEEFIMGSLSTAMVEGHDEALEFAVEVYSVYL